MLVQAALAFGASLVVALALANPLIAQLRASKFRQHAYEDAPKSHQSKTGTPTMGGLLFLIAPLVCLAFAHDAVTVAFAVLVFGSAAIGFVDDLSAIRADRNRGLRGRTKFVLTAVVGIAFLASSSRPAACRPRCWAWASRRCGCGRRSRSR